MRAPASLFQPEAYRVQVDRLRAKAKERGRSSEPASAGVSLSRLSGRELELCAVLAREVRAGEYQFAPLKRSEVLSDGKRRTIHRPELLDALVLGAVSARLTGLLESVLSDSVHAYRPGRSSRRVIEQVRTHLGEHRARVAPKERGVFVLQRDLAAYGESIPTGPDSRLWELVELTLRRLEDPVERQAMRRLIDAACRPTVLDPDGRREVMQAGLPTGSPIQQPLANLYLKPLDEELRARTAFYARFGDDLLVLTRDLSEAEAIAGDLDRGVDALGLRFSPKKTKNLYFTKPGRPLALATNLPIAPTSVIEYLGMRLTFDGRLGLSRKRLRQLLQRSRWRIENSARVAPAGHARACVARALNHALTATSSVADPSREALHTWVDDRAQLRQLDRQLAQLCAEVLSGQRGVRAFRHTSPSALREAGLASLLQLRRRHRRDG